LAIVNEDDFVARMKYTRSSLRVNSRVRIDVEWTEAGETHHVQGYTIDISSKGCLAVVAQGFAVGQKLRLKNLVNGRTMDATLVWRGHEGRAGWELGLELDGVAEDFWEIEF
jgi:PilZ domain